MAKTFEEFLSEVAEENAPKSFNNFRESVKNSETPLNKDKSELINYIKNLMLCCDENNLCCKSIGSIYINGYIHGVKFAYKVMKENGIKL